jgi:hypothetical protein
LLDCRRRLIHLASRLQYGFQEASVSTSYVSAGNPSKPPRSKLLQPSGDGLQIPLLDVQEMVYTVWDLAE